MKKNSMIIFVLLAIAVITISIMLVFIPHKESPKYDVFHDPSQITYQGYVVAKKGALISASDTIKKEEILTATAEELADRTEIYFSFPNEEMIKDVKVGQKVSIIHGFIMESYPAKSNASEIEVLEK
jgi:Protein of unknown function (DUF3221)